MKITPTISGERPVPTASGTREASTTTAATRVASSTALTADDITQAGLQSAQQTLNNDAQNDVDDDKVAEMQAMLATGDMQIDPDRLASDMLAFFQK
ncbi:flagellar biosynthesis anti-sigma factor FlgM [Citrobacter amalonaticus]|uniref:flagellar biosynthesis anti-sigma factor FlgM n=1 Tax=Citrobacter amalonaticus TaxID=35703 RepID=UPI001908B15A|nr:flagellar biosynthesis anti-sigma factor FlgM [Citrobacter amalonaticus]MBJ9260438.1 flagellar biosynthesis anti-sigma factor FlgM [Citrobacter amalonaticus]